MACGSPVVGFNVGGIPDMVSEKTGYLAKYKDEDDLAKGIDYILNLQGQLAISSREKALEFSESHIVLQHQNILKLLMQ